jgi:membrane dipeptidase
MDEWDGSQGSGRPAEVRPVVDLHTDSLIASRFFGYDLGKRHVPPLGFQPWRLHADFPRLAEGGVNGVWLGIVTSPFPRSSCLGRALRNLEYARREVGRNPQQAELALDPEGMLRIMGEGKIAVMLGVEGLHAAGTDLSGLEKLYDAGARYAGFAHFTDNGFASTNFRRNRRAPLTELGRKAVRWMNSAGMIIDLAHTHPDCLSEACSLSRAPVIISHTGVQAVRPATRNVSDDDIKRVAETGGIIGIIYATTWISRNPFCGLGAVVDHFDHVRELVGSRHLALGSDWDGFIMVPGPMGDAAGLPRLLSLMRRRGYTEEELEGICGGNFLRVFREVVGASG